MSLSMFEKIRIRFAPEILTNDIQLMEKASNEDIEFALQNGFYITKQLIETAPLSFLEKPVLFDTIMSDERPKFKYANLETLLNRGISQNLQEIIISELINDEKYLKLRKENGFNNKKIFLELLKSKPEIIEEESEISFDFNSDIETGEFLGFIRKNNIQIEQIPEKLLNNRVIVQYFIDNDMESVERYLKTRIIRY